MTRYLTALLLCLSLSAADIFVATDGDDGGGNGSIGSPYLTLEKARNVASAGDTVYLRGGTYYRTNTFELAGTNSGVTYRSYPGESAVLKMSRPISGWTSIGGGLYQTDVSTQGMSGITFKQLFYNGSRLNWARYPNRDSGDPIGGGWAHVSGTGVKTNFTYAAGDERSWTNTTGSEVVIFPIQYQNYEVGISGVNTGTLTISLSSAVPYNIPYSGSQGSRYFVQGILQELDAENEWHLDSVASILTWYPPVTPGIVDAPYPSNIVNVATATNITLRNLTLSCSERAALTLTNCVQCSLIACVVQNVGSYSNAAIVVSGGLSNSVVGNDISGVGQQAVYVSGGTELTLARAYNNIQNNWVRYACRDDRGNAAIYVDGVGNIIQRNQLDNCAGLGIRYVGQFHTIAHNVLFNVCQEIDDTGAIYTYNWDWLNSWGCVVSNNYIYDVTGYGVTDGGRVTPSQARGIYIDGHACGVTVQDNVVCHTSSAGLHGNVGAWNQVTNNIFYECHHTAVGASVNRSGDYQGYPTNTSSWIGRLAQYQAGWETVVGQSAWSNLHALDIAPTNISFGGTNGWTAFSNTVVRNIFVYTNAFTGTNSTYDEYFRFLYIGTNENLFDSNVVYHQGEAVRIIVATSFPGSSGGRITWAQWQGSGEDVNSSTNDPLLDTSNWQLDPASPALALGFQQIDTNWGCYYSSDRATWPLGQGGMRYLRAGTIRAGTLRGP